MTDETREKIKTKKDETINKAKEKGNKVLDWMVDNPMKTSIIAAVLGRIVTNVYREHKYQRAERARNTREYDPSLGMYYDLRRPLTNKEKLELSRRHSNGESIGDILESFHVLR